MRTDHIVMTGSLIAGFEAVESLKRKPSRLDRMAAFGGRWGFGKTTFIQWIYTQIPCFMATALAIWSRSANTMIEDLLRSYRIEAKGRLKYDFRELVRAARKHGLPLFIDEADRVVKKSLLIEIVRDLHDLARVPVILVGSENLISLLQRHDLGHVFSRVTEIVEFRELSTSDIQRISTELCDLRCDEKVAGYIRTITLGDFRLANTLLIRAEELASLNKSREITMALAREASSAMSFREEVENVKVRAAAESRQADELLRAVS